MQKTGNLFELAEMQLQKEKREGIIPCYTELDVIEYAIKIREYLDHNPNRVKNIMKATRVEIIKNHRLADRRYRLKKHSKNSRY